MNNQWMRSSGDFFMREMSQQENILPTGVYKLNMTPQGELYLTQIQDKFDFPYKKYGIETNFINRVIKTYDNMSTNLGVLMTGIKGTGKTVTSKQICNDLNLPVIIIHQPYPGIPSFINSIQQNIVVMIDEYEKVYPEKDYSVLTVMDGVLDNGFKKVFILTTNELYINSNMLQRPGRIRYLKTFKDLSIENITEIVDDMLINKEHRNDTIKSIAELEIITVDIVKAIVSEVNIHDELPVNFLDVFNVKKIENMFDVTVLEPGKKPEIIGQNVKIDPKKFEKRMNNAHFDFYVDGLHLGTIKEVISDDTIIVVDWDTDKDGKDIEISKKYVIEKARTYHSAFQGFAF
jgi:tRNA A37 threonylcarbamoyladenosine biosynthesis protein TsaE